MSRDSTEQAADADSLFLQADRFEESRQFARAFRCFLEAAELGHASSQLNLANYYSAGTGVRRNYAKAAYWYRKAYRNGRETAARNLAIDKLALGDTRAAIGWLRKGIEKKDGGSYVILARIYAKQRGGKSKAVKLLQRVARLNSDQASELDRENAEALLAEIRKDLT